MIYQGSKNRIAKEIVPIIQKLIDDNGVKYYYEPFVGGANVIDKIVCENKYGYDINNNLISLLKYIQSDTDVSIAPEDCTFEHYSDVRDCYNKKNNKYSKEYVSLVGYSASYGGRFFDGGYGRDKTGRNMYKERVKALKEQAPYLKDITFDVLDYKDIDPKQYKDSLFYLDPPYKSTKQYSKQNIDYNHFYEWCRQLGKNNIVIISEYNMPDDFECIWEKSTKCYQKSDRTSADMRVEKLFII
jgi:site-specific DNA-adenine methylase